MPPTSSGYNYKREYVRYRYYFGRIYQFYQKPVAKVSTALLLTIFTTIFFAVFAIRPTLVTIAELLRKIEDQQQVLAGLKNKAAALATAQQEYIAAGDKIDLLNQVVPAKDDVQPLIKNVEGLAATQTLPLDSIQVSEFQYPYLHTTSQSEPKELTVSTSLANLYPPLKQFITDIIRLPRLIALDGLTLSANTENTDTQTQPGEISLSINGRTFSLPPITSSSSDQ